MLYHISVHLNKKHSLVIKYYTSQQPNGKVCSFNVITCSIITYSSLLDYFSAIKFAIEKKIETFQLIAHLNKVRERIVLLRRYIQFEQQQVHINDIHEFMNALLTTNKASIFKNFTLLKNAKPFTLPANISEYSDSLFIRVTFKRFIKLKSFVSEKKYLQATYMNYIRYKYRIEDYTKKKQLILGEDHLVEHSWRQEIINSFNFIMQGFMVSEDERERTNIKLTGRIVKNLLNVHYNIMKLTAKPLLKKQKYNAQVRYREKFVHLQDLDNFENSQDKAFAHFDQCLVFLNEQQKMRL